MIYDGASLSSGRIAADLCVVGSGPGGAMVAKQATDAGLKVVVLEAGGLVTPGMMNQREEEMLPKLFYLSGSVTTEDRGVKVHQGKGVGGSSLHNTNLCKRIPREILETWKLERLGLEEWSRLYGEVEALLSVSAIDRADQNAHNRLLEIACARLGWRGGGLHHNRTGCVGSGFCELGCSYDAKNNALKVLIAPAVRAGCTVITHAVAERVLHDRGVRGVLARLVDPVSGAPRATLEIDAPRVCLSASAIGTAAILERSEVPDPSGRTGKNLHLHPAVVVGGDFDEPVRAWEGIPQSYECTEHIGFGPRDHRMWIVPAFGHPMAFAALLPGHGAEHRALMERYAHVAVFTAMLHDHTAGRVRADGLGHRIDYWPDASDRAELVHGLVSAARLMLAAGARKVFVPASPLLTIEREEELSKLADFALEPGATDLAAVHPMSAVPMSDDPARGPVGSDGRHHSVERLWVADGSLFPTSIGGPPQLSIYALGLHVGRALVAAG